MWRGFTSSSMHKVDGKGRVSVPALFRRVLEQEAGPDQSGSLFLIPRLRDQNCIEGFTPAYMERLARAIGRMKPFSKPRRQLERQFMSRAIPMQIDETGRIVLSSDIRAAVGIKGEALFVGMGDSFQIWEPKLYEAEEAADADDGDAFDQIPWDDDDFPELGA